MFITENEKKTDESSNLMLDLAVKVRMYHEKNCTYYIY